MSDTDSIEQTREALLAVIREKSQAEKTNPTSLEALARAFHLVATARPKDPESTVMVW